MGGIYCKTVQSGRDFVFNMHVVFFIYFTNLMLNLGDAKHGREDYVLSIDEMQENDFPLPTDVSQDAVETECNGMREHVQNDVNCLFLNKPESVD